MAPLVCKVSHEEAGATLQDVVRHCGQQLGSRMARIASFIAARPITATNVPVAVVSFDPRVRTTICADLYDGDHDLVDIQKMWPVIDFDGYVPAPDRL